MTLASCRAAPPPLPLTESVHCAVTAVVGENEYHLTVEKDSDEIATYRFTFPEAIDGLTYAFVGGEHTLSFGGLSYPAGGSVTGAVDRLHQVLTFDRSRLAYGPDGFLAETESGRFRILTLSDGNVSEIVSEDNEIYCYFNYAP